MLQPSGCPWPKKKSAAGGVLCPALVCWDEEISTSTIQGLPGYLSGMVGWNGGAGQGSSMVCHTIWNAPMDVVQRSSGALQIPSPSTWERQSARYCYIGCGGEVTLWLLLSLQKGPHHWSRNQNPGKKSQLPYLSPAYRKLQSLREMPTQEN